jgi:hypothetical protein
VNALPVNVHRLLVLEGSVAVGTLEQLPLAPAQVVDLQINVYAWFYCSISVKLSPIALFILIVREILFTIYRNPVLGIRDILVRIRIRTSD